MQVWADIYPFWTPPNTYYWRIVIDTIRNQFTVVHNNNSVASYQPTTVAYDSRDRLYLVSDWPPRPGVSGNIQFTVYEPSYIEIVGGGGGFKHVVYANGYKVAEKPYNSNWQKTGAFVPPPNPLAVPELAYYETILRTPVYVIR